MKKRVFEKKDRKILFWKGYQNVMEIRTLLYVQESRVVILIDFKTVYKVVVYVY